MAKAIKFHKTNECGKCAEQTVQKSQMPGWQTQRPPEKNVNKLKNVRSRDTTNTNG